VEEEQPPANPMLAEILRKRKAIAENAGAAPVDAPSDAPAAPAEKPPQPVVVAVPAEEEYIYTFDSFICVRCRRGKQYHFNHMALVPADTVFEGSLLSHLHPMSLKSTEPDDRSGTETVHHQNTRHATMEAVPPKEEVLAPIRRASTMTVLEPSRDANRDSVRVVTCYLMFPLIYGFRLTRRGSQHIF
jgi:hypothetical protein